MSDSKDAARLILVDDHPLVRDGLRARLEAVPGFAVVGEARHAEHAMTLAALLHERFPDIRVLVLSMHDNVEYVTNAVRAGARAYILKDLPGAEIICAIGAVLDGKTFFSEELGARLIQASTLRDPRERLTPRERNILDQLAEGLSSKQIAQRCGLSVRTVETHRQNLERKLEIDDQAEQIKFAVEHRRSG
ncbi:LuxR C-terminal-related transcriptional regulator [Paraburkholderia sabiae]|uniref:Response regulator transcription factor n=1 Tax=Paraburkholderia sabiae TaxID=273251 RepID=A0ABU9QRK9_9BURK|nr:response regulator transcription factor [Paraburkholderia sabiae]WJZ79454.1 response regulator transcription factor [Paraburkholderia sabiae]CAD6562766.1 Oxygen regulatory protein NreC [Paraburkholderia sabiae]